MKKLFFIFYCFIASYSFSQNEEFPLNVLIGRKYCSKCYSENNFLHIEVYNAFKKMKMEALKFGIEIQIVSGNRNFDRQKTIFNKKYLKYKSEGLSEKKILEKIIEYSTIPGTSRHHWGTDIDIIQKVKNPPKNLLTPTNYALKGPFENLKKWMDQNANKFGFYLVYTNEISRTGFKYEPWHYSYAPISKKLLLKFLEHNNRDEIYPILIKNFNIDNYFYNRYLINNILGVNPLLRKK